MDRVEEKKLALNVETLVNEKGVARVSIIETNRGDREKGGDREKEISIEKCGKKIRATNNNLSVKHIKET
jgi:hypothetical protein